jgi:hypothetical protein
MHGRKLGHRLEDFSDPLGERWSASQKKRNIRTEIESQAYSLPGRQPKFQHMGEQSEDRGRIATATAETGACGNALIDPNRNVRPHVACGKESSCGPRREIRCAARDTLRSGYATGDARFPWGDRDLHSVIDRNGHKHGFEEMVAILSPSEDSEG